MKKQKSRNSPDAPEGVVQSCGASPVGYQEILRRYKNSGSTVLGQKLTKRKKVGACVHTHTQKMEISLSQESHC